MVEDVALDAEIALRELKRANIAFESRRVETADDFRRALGEFAPDLILSDFSMPSFDGLRALAIARESCPEVPFIFVSGTIGEEHAIQALKSGATDYVLKGNLLRLPSAVERAVTEARDRSARRAREQASVQLGDILSTLHDVVWSVDVAAQRLLYVSPALSAVYHRTADQFYEKHLPWGELIHPDDRPRVAAEWGRATAAGSVDYEHRIVLPDGEIRWVHNRGQGVSDANGRVFRVDGISQDITERYERQRQIVRLSRMLLRTLRKSVGGKRPVDPRFVDFLARGLENPAGQLSHEQLSDRELQILLLIGSGRSIKQIAGDLSISINTVNTYRARILKKMGLRTNAALIRYAIEHGLVE
jgi:PAS domain S-box-containing protein